MSDTVPVLKTGVLNKNWRIYKDPTYPALEKLSHMEPMGQGMLFSDELDYSYLKRFPFQTGGSIAAAGFGAFMKFTFPLIRPLKTETIIKSTW